MAECPFCGELLGPNDFLPGKGAVCPRCGNRIAALAMARSPGPATAPPAQPRPASSPVTASRPASSPVKRSKPAQAPAPVAQPVADESEDEPEPGTSFLARLRHVDAGTLLALFVGSAALLLASIPPASFLTKPLSILGLLLGVLASLVPALVRGKNLILPVSVSTLSLFTLLFVGSWPKPGDPPPPPLLAVPLRQAGMVAHQPVGDGEWVDASANAVQMNDLRVRVLGVRSGNVELESQGKQTFSTEKYLAIRLAVSLEGIVFQQIPYAPWADAANAPSKHSPILTDNLERPYPQKTFAGRKIVGRADRNFLTPGRLVNEVLIFPVPPAKVEYLRLKLPASAFGGAGEFRFQIPRSMVEAS